MNATLIKLGDSWDISDDTVKKLKSLTCTLYGRTARVAKVDDLRLLHINEMCAKENAQIPFRNVDIASLPPCKKSLTQHIHKVSDQVGIWKRAHIAKPEMPNAYHGHGWKMLDGIMQPLWYEGAMLPQRRADIALDFAAHDSASDTNEFEHIGAEIGLYNEQSDSDSD